MFIFSIYYCETLSLQGIALQPSKGLLRLCKPRQVRLAAKSSHNLHRCSHRIASQLLYALDLNEKLKMKNENYLHNRFSSFPSDSLTTNKALYFIRRPHALKRCEISSRANIQTVAERKEQIISIISKRMKSSSLHQKLKDVVRLFRN